MKNLLESLWLDLRYGARMAWKNPGFTLTVVITLALGIGATTAMFSVVNSVLLRPLPFKEPGKLVVIKEVIPRVGPDATTIPAPDVLTFQREARLLEDVGGYLEAQMDLTGASQPLRITTVRITWNTFPLLGVAPMMGRTFSADEDQPESYLAVISYACWQQRFGSSADVLNQSIELDRKSHHIIGVMPPGFTFPLQTHYLTPPELWVPMGFTEREKAAAGSFFAYSAIARTKPGVSLAQAQAEVSSIMPQIWETYPAQARSQLQTSAVVIPLAQDTYQAVRAPLYILMAAVVFVLLIAIVNVANLMLARGSSRQKELALRRALGAGGRRLLAQLLTESVLLAIVGGGLGIALATLSTRLLLAIVPTNLPRLTASSIDWRVLLFALTASIISGLVFGGVPAFFALRTDLSKDLKEGGRSGSFGKPHQRLRSIFVITQVAMAFVLLIGSGLLIRSFQQVISVNGGFRPEHVTTGWIFLSKAQYPRAEQVQNFFTALLTRLRQIPGEQAVAVSSSIPLGGGWSRLITPDGSDPAADSGMNPGMYTAIQGDYFQTMGIPLIEGRFFTPEESINGDHAIIVSDSLAKKYFAGRDPIGRRLKYAAQQQESAWFSIVGVVGDIKQTALEEASEPHTYSPMTGIDISLLQRIGGVSVTMSVRTEGNSASSALQSAVWSLDPQLPVANLISMEDVVSASTAPRRFTMILVVAFAAAALLLAAVGLYGVMAYAVTQRTREIGIRVALGAQRRDILRMVLSWGMLLTLIGIAAGIAGAFAVTRLLTDFLFGVRALDPLTFVAVAVVLGLVALVACYIPAGRATRVDPMVALRYE